MCFCTCFPYFVTDKGVICYTFSSTVFELVLSFVKLGALKPRLSYDFERKFALIVYVYLEMYLILGTGTFRQKFLSEGKFRENLHSESLTVHVGVNKFVSVLFTSVFRFR
jgi:hypothetical protein